MLPAYFDVVLIGFVVILKISSCNNRAIDTGFSDGSFIATWMCYGLRPSLINFMKIKTILIIVAVLILAALIGANIYDWNKQDNFKTNTIKPWSMFQKNNNSACQG